MPGSFADCSSRILAIGVAYKPGVPDQRESPSLAVMEKLGAKGAVVTYNDPFVPRIQLAGANQDAQPLSADILAAQDCVAILTAHQEIDYGLVTNAATLVFDARGVTLGMDAPNVVRL